MSATRIARVIAAIEPPDAGAADAARASLTCALLALDLLDAALRLQSELATSAEAGISDR